MTKQAAKKYPTTIAKPITPNETQDTGSGPRFNVWHKGSLTRSEIYERLLPDGESAALRIDGPADSAIVLDSKGCLRLLTGERSKEQGPGSGKLCIKTNGQQQLHQERTDIQYNAGDDEEEQAVNVLAYGDYVEQTIGGTRYIKAQKIVIEASEELLLIGKTQVNIQAGADGTGAIIMNAGNVEKITTNDKDVIIGQKMEFGVSEKSTISFDPRASSNVVSPGHINHKILGDLQTWVGGIEQHVVAGGTGAPPLIKARDSSFTAKTTGNVNISSTIDTSIASGATTNITAAGVINVIGVGNVNIKGATIFLN
jgi:hypothetical protein